MLIIVLSFYSLFANSFAWLSPERCAQGNEHQISFTAARRNVRSVLNIGEIAAKQHQALLETYKNYQFSGVPIRAITYEDNGHPQQIEIHAPFNCSFHTYDPRLLSSVACSNVACKLIHTVSTVDTYTASEGYNWGVKISSKFSLASVFEVGGEASTGGIYTCTYNKGRTTTDTVECYDSSGESGHLQLYNVKSDMVCDFGQIKLARDYRDNEYIYGISEAQIHFTFEEMQELKGSAQVILKSLNIPGITFYTKFFMMDTNKISDILFQKFKNKVPLYNPYTDFLWVDPDYIGVLYLKEATTVQQYRRIIPFTNEAGDSVFQYACTKEPF